MAAEMKPTSMIIARLGLQPRGPVHAFFTATCAKHNDPFVPFRKGALAETVIIDGQPTANVKVDRYIYEQHYARYVYHGVTKSGKKMKYNYEKHRLAGPFWDERMWSAKKDDIIKEVQDFVDRGAK